MNKTAIYESFKYIHAPTYEVSQLSILDKKYKTIDMLEGRFIVYNSKEYRVYPCLEEFIMWFESISVPDRCFHEVIFSRGQKLKFDIDATIAKLNAFDIPAVYAEIGMRPPPPYSGEMAIYAFLDDLFGTDILGTEKLLRSAAGADNSVIAGNKYDNVLETIIRAIKDAFFVTYGFDIKRENLVICESADPTGRKYSNHIIIDGYYVGNHVQSKEFTMRVVQYLPTRYRTFIDMSVNKSIQNFRAVGCHKVEDTRVKTVITGHPTQRCFITAVSDCVLLPDIAESVPASEKTLHPDDVKRIITIADRAGLLVDHKFKLMIKGTAVFTRLRPSDCEFCDRRHDSDNTLILSTNTVDGIVAVYKQCRRYNDENGGFTNGAGGFTNGGSALIGEFTSQLAPADLVETIDRSHMESRIANWSDREIIRCIDQLERAPLYATGTEFDNLPVASKHIYDLPTIKPLECVPTLVVHAAMKMGKTKALIDYIDTYFPTGLREPIIRFISFRQTFSSNIKEKFTEFTLYSDVRGPLTQNKLIVQVESIYRLDVRAGIEAPDLLILDECESIFEQFDSGLLKSNFIECFAKFQWLIKYSKHVICMDAGISDRTYRILGQMRPWDGDNSILYHRNECKNARADSYYFTGEKAKWLGILYSSVEADERIAVPTSSLAEAKTLRHNLALRYPAKNIRIYSSETKTSEKRAHFSDVGLYWSQLDVLIYTPTVSAGVSFEKKHFAKVFGYFTDQSCPIETCIQMIGRIRDVADNQFYICLSATGNILPADIRSIKQWVKTKRNNLVTGFDRTGLAIEYSPVGELICHSGDYFQVWLENTQVRNLSKNSFIRRFIHVVTNTGATANFMSDDVYLTQTGIELMIDGILNSEVTEIIAQHKIARGDIREQLCKQIAASVELTEDEVEDIQTAIIAQEDITDPQRHSFEKYRLRQDYNYDGIIDEKFVDRYHDPKVRRMYKNITRVYLYDSPEETWKQIQVEERAIHTHLMESGVNSMQQDLTRKYVFDQHRYALGLLRLCGWESVVDPQFIHSINLTQNFAIGKNNYWDSIGAACSEFGFKPPRLQNAAVLEGETLALIALMIKPINNILFLMYGITITAKKQDAHMFFLKANTYFTLDADISNTKRIPFIASKQAVGFG